jgi:hypothetical protein
MGTRHKIYTISGKSQLSIAEIFKIKHFLQIRELPGCSMLVNFNGSSGTFTVRRSGLTLECGAPVPLWIWYYVTNIQQMPKYRSFTAELKRRRVAALERLFHNHKTQNTNSHT